MDKHNTIKLQAMVVLALGAWLFTMKPALGVDLKNEPIEHLMAAQFDINVYSIGTSQKAETQVVHKPLPTSTPLPALKPQVAVYTANKPTHTPDSINHTSAKVVLADSKGELSTSVSQNVVRSLIIKYSQEYRVSTAKMLTIAECESGFNPNAVNGSFGGLYQFLASTWQSNRRAMGLDDDPSLRFNAEESVRTAAFKMSRDGFGAWPVCSTM